MDVFEAIRSRRTVRNFRPDTVSPSLLMEILEAATWAPSHRNTQPWEFIQIGPSTRQQLIPVFQKQLEDGPLKNPELPEERAQAMRQFATDFGGAPELLAVTCQPGSNQMDIAEFPLAVTAAIENLLLAAWAKGLGAVWISLGFVPDTYQILQIKNGFSIIAIIALGYPNTVPPALPRIAVQNKLSKLP